MPLPYQYEPPERADEEIEKETWGTDIKIRTVTGDLSYEQTTDAVASQPITSQTKSEEIGETRGEYGSICSQLTMICCIK